MSNRAKRRKEYTENHSDNFRDHLTWENDTEARNFVAQHPEGATLKEIGDHFGVSRERVRQIQKDALLRLRRELERMGLTQDDIRSYFADMMR